MLTLIKNATVFAPEPLGQQQVLIAGSTIAAIEDKIELSGAALATVDAQGQWLVPGLVDALTHPAGGGGEGGFGNRTQAVSLEDFVQAGVTTPVGALGTDSIGRSLEVLYGDIMALRQRGLDAYMYTGSYRVPADTITGDVTRDLVLLEPVIGVGEVAISDHRSSQPEPGELRRIAAQARLGGIVSGQGGTVMVHVGDGLGGLDPLRQALHGSDLPTRCFYPTHTNRSARLLDDAVAFALAGGFIDFTASTTPEFIAAGEVPALDALSHAIADGVPAARLTMSSDAGGSLPHYDGETLKALAAATPASLLQQIQTAMRTAPELVGAVIAALTANPAAALGLHDVGRITPSRHANLLMLEPDTGALSAVMCRGRWLLGFGAA